MRSGHSKAMDLEAIREKRCLSWIVVKIKPGGVAPSGSAGGRWSWMLKGPTTQSAEVWWCSTSFWGWPSSKRPHIPIVTALSSLSWVPVILPALSPSQGNVSVSNQARNQKVWALPVQNTQNYSDAHYQVYNWVCSRLIWGGVVLTRIWLNPLFSL